MNDGFVWGIFVVDDTQKFPNFFPIGIYTTREEAIKEIDLLSKHENYQLLSLPLNSNFAYFHKISGKLVGMNAINHEHYHFKDGFEETKD